MGARAHHFLLPPATRVSRLALPAWGLLLVLVWLALPGGAAYAQRITRPGAERNGPVVRDTADTAVSQTLALGYYLNTHGMGFDISYARPASFWGLNWVGTVDLASLKNRQEHAVESFYRSLGSRYVYGKKNHAYLIGLSAGLEKPVVPFSRFSRFSLSVGASLGLNLALLKPYYLLVIDANQPNQQPQERPFDPGNDTYVEIIGTGSYFRGFNAISVVPGLKARGYVLLNLAGDILSVRAIKLGVSVEVFPHELEIMHTVPNQAIYVNAQLGFLIGGSW